ncbi:hypothetical protein DYH09_00250 [bacterium CPR1]|nr:hypothetical protein [bacterium CPR1]
MRRKQGIAIVVVLLVMAIMAAVAVGITTLGLGNLSLTGSTVNSERAVYAAEAGVHHALAELKSNPGLASLPGTFNVGSGTDLRYTVEIFRGALSPPASPVEVPANHVYVLGTGILPSGVTRRVGVMVGSGGSPWIYAGFAANKIAIKQSSQVQSYDSALGLVSIGTIPNVAHLGSNLVDVDAILVDGSSVDGTGYSAPAAPPGAISLINGGTIAGTTSMGALLDLPLVGLPSDPDATKLKMPADPTGTGMPSVVIDDAGDLSAPPFITPGVLPSGTYEKIEILGNFVVTLEDGGTYTFGDIVINDANASIEAPVGASLGIKVWVENKLEIADGSVVNPSAQPSMMDIKVMNGPVTIKDRKSAAFYTVYAPAADVTIVDHCALLGGVVANNLTVDDFARLIYDVQLQGVSTPGVTTMVVKGRDRM